MQSLDLDPSRVLFPHRCLRCGAAPTGSYTLTADAGFDVLVFAVKKPIPMQVPLCEPCSRRQTLGRVAWVVSVVAGIFAFFVAIIYASVAAREAGAPLPPSAVAASFLAGFGALWWLRNREDRLYHRLFSPVWLVSFRSVAAPGGRERVARLGFREERTAREVGVLSGVLDQSQLDVEGSYREHAAPVPPAFSPPPEAARWWVGFLVGLALMAVGVWKYLALVEAERTGKSVSLHSLLWLLYQVGGKGGVLGGCIALGLLACAGSGRAAWRARRR
jgi:hypothetical protein